MTTVVQHQHSGGVGPGVALLGVAPAGSLVSRRADDAVLLQDIAALRQRQQQYLNAASSLAA